MRKDYTHIPIVLDRSGSMSAVRSSTIEGFNKFLDDQQRAPGEATLTLVLFDHEYALVHEQLDIKAVQPLTDLTYIPRGTTALLDAIGRTIDMTGKHLRELDVADRPSRVLFVIVTDGLENASERYSIEKVNKMIEHQRSTYQWEFVFLGANQDAITSASKIGIAPHSTMTYAANDVGTMSAFRAASHATASYRTSQDAFVFTAADRAAQTVAGVDPALNAVPTSSTEDAAKVRAS